ncbi:restriction endonuclease [Halorussus lipolyticus]|uniref:restriction endonuclease n=1 Tax=Halorussus lipolyticus TaxID=3034024 RepID=UPI0023E7D7AC|nr:restriction endonuclease [Halorussus sp. DT80]
MLQGMDQSEFGQFVAALWERQGWQTQVKQDDGRTFVAVQRPQSGEEGLLWARPGDEEVGGKEVQQFAKLCQQYEVDESAIVTAGVLSDHAKKVAQGSPVELLDGEGVAKILKQKGWTDLAEEYAGGGSGGGGGGDSPVDQAKQIGQQVSAKVSDALGDTNLPSAGKIPTKPLLAVVVLVAVLGAGVLVGPSIPLLGGGGGGAPIAAESAAPANSTTTLSVSWNARVTDEIDPNESDTKYYGAPRGEQFVLVRMSINNTGNGTVTVKQANFKLRTENRTYGYQPLTDHDGFVDFPISSGQRYVGWTVFAVPKGTSGTLVYEQNASEPPVAVEFTHDPAIAVNVTQR